MNDERTRYFAMELSFAEEVYEHDVITELEEHLKNNGYDFYISSVPGLEQIMVLIVSEEHMDYIETILDDRDIEYRYV